MKRPLLEILQDWAGLAVGGAALLYVFGFTVHWAYFRLLGIDINGEPLDYLRFAADYSASVVSSIPQLLLAFEYYSPKLKGLPLIWLTILCSVIMIAFFGFYLSRRARTLVMKRRCPWFMIFWWALNIIIVISFYLLLKTEFDIAKVSRILQPVDAAEIQQMQNQLSPVDVWTNAALLEIRARNVARVYERYTQTQKDSPAFPYFNDWFNPTVRPHNSTERRAVYLALLLVNLILLLAVILQLWSLRSNKMDDATSSGQGKLWPANPNPANLDTLSIAQKIGPKWSRFVILVLCSGLLMQVFLFPFIYATLGRNLTYPLVMLRLSMPSKPHISGVKNDGSTSKAEANKQGGTVNGGGNGETWTHCVYLIADLDNEVIVFDRLNFFQVKRVPRERILTISQVFAASPFESCGVEEGTFTPCETLWMPEQTPVSEF